VFSEAAHPVEVDAVAALRRAIELTDAFTITHGRGLEMGGEPPHLSPTGPASSVAGSPQVDDDAIAGWFLTLATILTEGGWSGVLQPQRWQDRPDEGRHREPWIAVTLALGGWAHRARQVVVSPWQVHRDLVSPLVRLVMEWTRGVDGELWFTRLSSVQGEEPRVAEALQARLSETGSRGFATVHRQGTAAERRARFSSYGHVTLEERSSLPLEQRMAGLRLAWAEWATRVDRSATTGDVGPSHPSWFIELARRDTMLPRHYYPHGRHLDDQRVPDPCVEQVLTHAHLDAANDLSDWRVEEVAAGRFLVSHPHPSQWLLPPARDGLGTRVDPETLAKAREDFGGMVLAATDR